MSGISWLSSTRSCRCIHLPSKCFLRGPSFVPRSLSATRSISVQCLHAQSFVFAEQAGPSAGRKYHSQAGVYGYRPEARVNYEVPADTQEARNKYSNFHRLVSAYRLHGHRIAPINPIDIQKIRPHQELEPRSYGLQGTDHVSFRGILSSPLKEGSISDAVNFLNKVYSKYLTAEFMHLEEEEEREWFAKAMEDISSATLDNETRKSLAIDMQKAQAFENFLGTKFVTLKRYSGEGAESMMGFYTELFKLCVKDGLQEIVLCMPHRGRTAFLVGLLHFPPVMVFRKLKGLSEFPEEVKATGDVLTHYTNSVDLNVDGKIIHVTLLYNPSHLEAVNPVSMGKTRARQQSVEDGAYSDSGKWSDKVLNFQVHGDAAIINQGINQEMLAMAQVPHFEVGGSVHLIVNNQVGFTTPGNRGRSSRYCSDIAKMIAAPILHVNGDHPEEVVKAARVAIAYQRKFRKDVFVDLNCYRKWGHNELDDPTFTNPAVYKIINSQRSVPDRYVDTLIENKLVTKEEITATVDGYTTWLNNVLKSMDAFQIKKSYFKRQWSTMKQAPAALTIWDTGVAIDTLKYVGHRSVAFPENFTIHPHLLKTHVNTRVAKLQEGSKIDWATAEALAVGSLLYEGYFVRISGQDVGRGTFSHRHFMLVDQETNEMYIPFNDLIEGQKGHLEVANSTLSEEAVLAYEYGMSIENPNKLIMWEAQFGDFFNGAQIPIDTFVTGGETKWMTCSGLVMLLPHGYDGAGPEHSSSRLERFLQLSDSKEALPDGDDVNIHIANPTTPAQYFHLLRRQMVRDYRKPLIIISPKTLLRSPDATSSLTDMTPGKSFASVIGDQEQKVENIKRVVFVSGKHFYALDKYRKELGIRDTALIRLEGLSPFPTPFLQEEIEKYRYAKYFIWSQEEPQNMGAWSFVRPRFENLLGRKLKYSGRPPLATPAVGIGELHNKEAQVVTAVPFTLR